MVFIYGWGSSLAYRASVVWVILKALEPNALLVHPVHACVSLRTPVRQIAHGKLPDLCSRSRPVAQIMIVVFSVFTQPLPLHTLLPSQQFMDTFFHGVCNNDNAICIKILPRHQVNSQHLSNEALGNSLNDFHSLHQF